MFQEASVVAHEFTRSLLRKTRGTQSKLSFGTSEIGPLLPLDDYASTYSTGMKKKLALNAILLQKNKVFILDEPFNGVDIQSNMLIIEIIKKLKEEGKTMLISSHIFATLRNTCDEIHLLKAGEIVKTASPEEFDELEASMIDHQFQHQMNNISFS